MYEICNARVSTSRICNYRISKCSIYKCSILDWIKQDLCLDEDHSHRSDLLRQAEATGTAIHYQHIPDDPIDFLANADSRSSNTKAENRDLVESLSAARSELLS